MTYGLDLFSDAPPASMPMTATITTTLGGLLACSLSMIQDRASALRIVAFALIMGLGATTVQAGDFVSVTQVRNLAAGDAYTGTPGNALSAANQHLVGEWVPATAGGAVTRITPVASVTVAGIVRECGAVQFYAAPHTYRQRCESGGSGGYIYVQLTTAAGEPPACAEGETRDPNTGICTEPPCTAGETSTLNLGVGYAKTTANTDDWIDPQFYTTACVSGCQATVGNVVSGSCYVSGIVGPPFPGYCEFETVTTGNECTAADEAANATLPAIPCPSGMQEGTVNGARGCYKVTDVTKETTTTQNPDGTTTTTETITGPTGTTTTTTTCTGDGSCSTTIRHIGGGAGTGAPGETGQDYDGKPTGSDTPSEGEDDQGEPCGREGLPDCKVKVNEDGTPTEVEGAQEFLDGVVDGIQERYDYLGGMGWVVEDLPFVWSPAIPSGSCSAYEIYGYTIDICDPLGKARAIWAWVISVLAAIYIWRTAAEVNKGA